MNKKIFFLILSALPLIFSNKNLLAEDLMEKKPETVQVEIKQLDKEAKILAAYLASFNSPLQYHAQDFIDAARKYHLDWKLLPAISGVESTFGQFTPGGYNAWGWGVYGNQAIYFGSWKEAIFTVAKGLREDYLDKGLTDPYAINKVYAVSPNWGGKVSYFMQDLEKFAAAAPKIAAVSGQLVTK